MTYETRQRPVFELLDMFDKISITNPNCLGSSQSSPLWESFGENYIATELLKRSKNSPLTLSFFRKQDQQETDCVLEQPNRDVVALEIKSRAIIDKNDFKEMYVMQKSLGEKFKKGVVLLRGRKVFRWGMGCMRCRLGYFGEYIKIMM